MFPQVCSGAERWLLDFKPHCAAGLSELEVNRNAAFTIPHSQAAVWYHTLGIQYKIQTALSIEAADGWHETFGARRSIGNGVVRLIQALAVSKGSSRTLRFPDRHEILV